MFMWIVSDKFNRTKQNRYVILNKNFSLCHGISLNKDNTNFCFVWYIP